MSAPKGNKFAIGNKGGAPAFYETAQELMDAVMAYFDYIEGEFEEIKETFIDDKGQEKQSVRKEWIRKPEKPSVTGLTLFLGFQHRRSLDDQEKRGDEFSYIIKRAKLVVENGYEGMLQGDKPTGAIFALKNMGWKDKTETGFTDNEGNDVNPVTVFQLPDNGRAKTD